MTNFNTMTYFWVLFGFAWLCIGYYCYVKYFKEDDDYGIYDLDDEDNDYDGYGRW